MNTFFGVNTKHVFENFSNPRTFVCEECSKLRFPFPFFHMLPRAATAAIFERARVPAVSCKLQEQLLIQIGL